MKNFKQLFAIIFAAAVVVFGILIMIDERDMFSAMSQLSFDGWPAAKVTIAWILIIGADVALIALPALGFVLVLLDKYDPFKVIANCALVMLCKFVVSIIAVLLVLSAAFGSYIDWNQVFFGKDSMLIIPTLVFGLALVAVFFSKFSNFEGTLARPVFATIGSALAIFGLIYYFGIGGGTGGILNGGSDSSWLGIMGLIIGIACFAGLVVYCFLPQTKKAE